MFGRHSFFNGGVFESHFGGQRGFSGGAPRPSFDPFEGLGGINSFFGMFFNAAAGLGGFDNDDPFVHPMTRSRPDRHHFHQKQYTNIYFRSCQHVIEKIIVMPDGTIKRIIFKVGPRQDFDEEVNFDNDPSRTSTQGFRHECSMPRKSTSKSKAPTQGHNCNTKTRPSTNSSDKPEDQNRPKFTFRRQEGGPRLSASRQPPVFINMKNSRVPRFNIRRQQATG